MCVLGTGKSGKMNEQWNSGEGERQQYFTITVTRFFLIFPHLKPPFFSCLLFQVDEEEMGGVVMGAYMF